MSDDDLRERIQSVYDGDDRLWQRDYLGRKWLAIFAADAAYLADYVAKLLDNRSYAIGMPTTTGGARSATSPAQPEHDYPPSASAASHPLESKALAHELEQSESSTIYVDLPGMDDKQAEAMLAGDPPLHVEHDAVRDKWAVRKASDSEVADAKAAEEAEHPQAAAAVEA
jgi:hypothetical protein